MRIPQAALLALLGLVAGAAVHARPSPPPEPAGPPTSHQPKVILPDPYHVRADGSIDWIDGNPTDWMITHNIWNPAINDMQVKALEKPVEQGLASTLLQAIGATSPSKPALLYGGLVDSTVLPDGFAWVSQYRTSAPLGYGMMIGDRVFVLDSTTPRSKLRIHMLALSAESFAVISRDDATRHIVVNVVHRDGDVLVNDVMPELPVAYDYDFAFVALDAHRLMILGGSDQRYRGCMDCRADTHILDIRRKAWSDGPRMVEARSEFDATRLPDGSVLVSGGWTKQAGWGYYGPSRTAEIWKAGASAFDHAAPMPTGDADHHGMWMPGREGKTLLMVNGTSAAVPAYDVASGTWRIIAAGTAGAPSGGMGLVPFAVGGRLYAWESGNRILALRPYWNDALAPSSSHTDRMYTGRMHPTWLPASGSYPTLIIGGQTPNGADSTLASATVEAVDTQGRIMSMPSLNDARIDARAYRMGAGVLVFNGRLGGPDSRKADPPMGIEWLAEARPGTHSAWQRVDGTPPAPGDGIGELPDGRLLDVDAKGRVTEIRLVMDGGTPVLKRTPWPDFAQPRHADTGDPVTVRALADGRIIAAGGYGPRDAIALLGPDSGNPDATDTYRRLGPASFARTYAMFDPATRQWSDSARTPDVVKLTPTDDATPAPADMSSEPADASPAAADEIDADRPQVVDPAPSWWEPESMQTTVLDSGAVLQVITGIDPASADANGVGTVRPYILLSQPNGRSWTLLPPETYPHIDARTGIKLFSVDGEVFMQSPGDWPREIDWFNPANRTWVTVWTLPTGNRPPGLLHVTTLPDGHTLVLKEHEQ